MTKDYKGVVLLKHKKSKYDYLEGKTLNNIQVLSKNTDVNKNGCFFNVKCLKCGKIYLKTAYSLLEDMNYSCGCVCYGEDLTNKKYGSLTVIRYLKTTSHGEKMWECKCDCGEYSYNTSNQLTKGYVTRCKKCSYKITGQKNSKPPKFSERLRECYVNMKTRVTNAKQDIHNRYINRNISMCKEWLDDYYAFEKWALENGYQENLTIDRIDNNGNYCPENCRWVDRKVQANNRRTNVILEYNGEKNTMAYWSEKLNIPYWYLQMNHNNKTMEEMLYEYNNSPRHKGKSRQA